MIHHKPYSTVERQRAYQYISYCRTMPLPVEPVYEDVVVWIRSSSDPKKEEDSPLNLSITPIAKGAIRQLDFSSVYEIYR